jgi:hypothetical protein
MTYNEAIEAAIEKQIDTIGESMAIEVAEETEGLNLNSSGSVESVSGDGEEVLRRLADNYVEKGSSLSTMLISEEISDRGIDDIELPDNLS